MQRKFRRDTIRGTFIPFNAHTRKCLGQAFVLLQMKIAVFELVRSTRWKVDPGYKLKLPGVSFLSCPRMEAGTDTDIHRLACLHLWGVGLSSRKLKSAGRFPRPNRLTMVFPCMTAVISKVVCEQYEDSPTCQGKVTIYTVDSGASPRGIKKPRRACSNLCWTCLLR